MALDTPVRGYGRSRLIPKHGMSLPRASLFPSPLHKGALLNQIISTIHDHEKEKRAQKPYCSPKSLNVRLLLATPTVVLPLLLLTLCALFST